MNWLKARVIRGSLWMTVARGTTNALNVVSTIILARLLIPADFGLVALALTMLMLLEGFTELSVSQALIHTREPTTDHYNTAWSLSLARGVLIGVAFTVAAPFVASAYSDPRLEEVMFALAISAVAGGLQNPKIVMLRKDLSFHQQSILSICSKLVNVASAITVAVLFQSYWALIVGLLAGQVTNVILSYILVPFRPALRWRHLGELWRYSMWLSLSQIIDTVNYRFDHLLVGTYLGRTDLGLYHVGSKIAMLPSREILFSLRAVLFPAFSLAQDDPKRLRRLYQRVQSILTAIALPASVGLGLIADPLVRLAMGERWLDSIPVIQLLAAMYSIETLGSLAGSVAMAKGETRLIFVRAAQSFIIRVPMIVAGMVLGGLLGVLYGRMIAVAAGTVINMSMIDRMTGLSLFEQMRANLRAILATIAMVLAVVLLRTWAFFGDDTGGLLLMLAVTIALSVFVYVTASWLLWRLAGNPRGPETEALELGTKILKSAGLKWAM